MVSVVWWVWLLGVLAAGVGLYATVPQVAHVVRTRNVEGLAWSTVVLCVVTFVIWTFYGAAMGDWVQGVNNAVAFVLYTVLAVVVASVLGWRHLLTVAAAAAAAAAVSGVLVWLWGPLAVALLGTTVGSSRMLPQVWVAVRGLPMGGVSVQGTVLATVGHLLWTGYASVMGDAGLLVSSLIGLTLQGVVTVRRVAPSRTTPVTGAVSAGPPVPVPVPASLAG